MPEREFLVQLTDPLHDPPEGAAEEELVRQALEVLAGILKRPVKYEEFDWTCNPHTQRIEVFLKVTP